MIRYWIQHLRNSHVISSMLKGKSLYEHLYWYDQPLHSFLGFKGILKFIIFRMRKGKDELSENYSIKSLYYGKPVGDGLNRSGATTWNYLKLKNDPIIINDPICNILEANAGQIIKEYEKNIGSIKIHPDNADLAKDGEWSGIFLYGVGGKKNPELASKFKKTYQVLEQIPISKNFGFVLISKLTPGTKILPHCGSSNLRFRYHLGLEIPEPDQVKIRVATQWKTWETGHAFGFDDSFEHEVIHDGAKNRVVLIVDTWNPTLTPDEISILDQPIFHSFGRV